MRMIINVERCSGTVWFLLPEPYEILSQFVGKTYNTPL
jgi:hypothetical protein